MAHDELEIERSWVIEALPDEALIDHSIYHEIGYLFNTDGELRVFKKRMPGSWKYGLTVKEDGDLFRKEWEEKDFPEWAFNVVWPNTENFRFHKIRHFVYYLFDGRVCLLEIDEYKQNLKGLIRLECEFQSNGLAEEFILPDWVQGPVEVTKDSRYKNKNLAKLTRKEFKGLTNDLSLSS